VKNLPGTTKQAARSSNRLIYRIVGVVLLAAAILLAREVFSEAIAVSVVTLPSAPEQHQTALDFAPDNPSVQSWIGAFYMLSPSQSDPQQALEHYKEALRLDPMYYAYWGELGSAYELSGNLDLAEKSYRNMIVLAPANERSHWLLANCLLRKGDVQESLSEFKKYLEINPQACDYVYELLSKAQGVTLNDIDQFAVPSEGTGRARFALFAVNHGNPALAVKTWQHLSAKDLESQGHLAPQIINGLVSAKLYDEAKAVWSVNAPDQNELSQLLLNGSFERDLASYHGSFGWQSQQPLSGNITLTSREVRTGKSALRIDLTGENSHDAATLSQVLAPIPAGRYSLTYFAKGSRFTPATQPLLRIVGENGLPVATDQPPSGDYDWTKRQIEFTLQSPKQAIVIFIQTPAITSFDSVGNGQIFLDDFAIEKRN